VRRRQARAQTASVDPAMSRLQIDETLAKLSGCSAFAIAAFAPVTAARGSVSLGGELPYAVESLALKGKPLVLIALGNPYLLRSFPSVAAYLATFTTVPPSELSAVKAIFGETAIRGRLPVSIPGLAKLGDGIQLGGPR